jgi:hypothetical protein
MPKEVGFDSMSIITGNKPIMMRKTRNSLHMSFVTTTKGTSCSSEKKEIYSTTTRNK